MLFFQGFVDQFHMTDLWGNERLQLGYRAVLAQEVCSYEHIFDLSSGSVTDLDEAIEALENQISSN